MAAIEIEKLALKLTGLSEHEGHVLAWKIREALALAPVAGSVSGRMDSVKIGVERREGEDVDSLSRRIVSNLLLRIGLTG
jgi:hypothetical protein